MCVGIFCSQLVLCVRGSSVVDTLSKSECLTQSFKYWWLAVIRCGLVAGGGLLSVQTLSLLCMVRRKTPCKLVALTVRHTALCARVPTSTE